ncbi:hypothetical protein QTJ16_006760 [Diplocarpon rosae]|uniref:Apple domain-containing protein n=1 Tax=Diplocarpon rosae TaxID=946125 RepID=A0AAD9SUS2_9HELO|nr:hypothetical protein QTJ16_006760 [Diplocarpon rosae]
MKAAVIVSGLVATALGMAVEKRDGTCARQPAGTGPSVHIPDTPKMFRAYPVFTAAAVYASVLTKFTSVFTSINNSTQQTNYLGSTLLNDYDATQCGSFCEQTTGCAGFNLFFERDPSQDPNPVNCPNPASVTNIKCVAWGVPLTAAGATNSGQKRADFQVAIAGVSRPSSPLHPLRVRL